MSPQLDLPLPLRSHVLGRNATMAPTIATLAKLPNELLSLVINHLDRPKDLVNLALTCRRLNSYAQLDGWKALQRGRFGLLGLDGDAKNAVHGLTTLYRNWDKKAFTARYLEPSANITSLNSGEKEKWRGPRGQTMGYQPSIDSYEEMRGAWTDRREVLAWSAGTNVLIRVQETGSNAARVWQEMGINLDGPYEPGMFTHPNAWFTYKIPQGVEGRDDITALKLLRPHQTKGDAECVMFGTASGRLSMLYADLEQRQATEQLYNTDRRAVGSISISSAAQPLIAATLGDSSLVLYPTGNEQLGDAPIGPLSQVRPIGPGMRVGWIWSCSFISDDKIAIGLGPSYEPVQIYDITPEGLAAEPLRTFNFNSRPSGVDANSSGQRNTSVYPILPIPTSSQGGSRPSDIFLSGGYDGIIRLHDLRSPRDFETIFWDVTNDSTIYSLACQGLERFVAGGSMHSMLKVFDLRFSGSHAYHHIPVPSTHKPRPKRQDYTYNAIVDDVGAEVSSISGGWNLFLHPRNANRHPYRPGPSRENSPVYSLSIPSPTSPNLYAGLEGAVQNLAFVSVLDAHPDPLISPCLTRSPMSQSIDIKASYNPFDNVLNLGMYEQGSEEGLGMQLLIQDDVGEALARNEKRRVFARQKGIDERWKDPGEEGEKWVRGQVPQGQHARRGGGRGRGRGRVRGGGRA